MGPLLRAVSARFWFEAFPFRAPDLPFALRALEKFQKLAAVALSPNSKTPLNGAMLWGHHSLSFSLHPYRFSPTVRNHLLLFATGRQTSPSFFVSRSSFSIFLSIH
jgi:hypothetical protein